MKKDKIKIYPYSEKSLSIKSTQIKIFLSLLQGLVLTPIAGIIIELLTNQKESFLFLCLEFIIISAFCYLLKNRRRDFTKWEFLDDEVPISQSRNDQGDIIDIKITKHIVLLLLNIAFIVPMAFTFSIIMAGSISFLIGLLIHNIGIVNLIKFTIIALVFKNLFTIGNEFLINKMKD